MTRTASISSQRNGAFLVWRGEGMPLGQHSGSRDGIWGKRWGTVVLPHVILLPDASSGMLLKLFPVLALASPQCGSLLSLKHPLWVERPLWTCRRPNVARPHGAKLSLAVAMRSGFGCGNGPDNAPGTRQGARVLFDPAPLPGIGPFPANDPGTDPGVGHEVCRLDAGA